MKRRRSTLMWAALNVIALALMGLAAAYDLARHRKRT